MKETGIIMSGDHPQLILDGTKLMTRRTWGLEKINDMPYLWGEPHYNEEVGMWLFWQQNTGDCIHIKCPYGHIGDLLWVRELWLQDYHGFHSYHSDYFKPHPLVTPQGMSEGIRAGMYWKKSSMFMPRKDSRIQMPIDLLRPLTLQEISEEDAIAEGIERHTDRGNNIFWYEIAGDYHGDTQSITPIESYAKLWDSLNAKRGYPWAGNWWVWVIGWSKLISVK